MNIKKFLKLSLLIFILSNFLNVKAASATNNIYSAVKDGDGYLACEYKNDDKGHVQIYYFPEHSPQKSSVSLLNGFTLNNQWAIVVNNTTHSNTGVAWGATGGDGGPTYRAFSNIFGSSTLYYCENSNHASCTKFINHYNENNFSCPKYVYADFNHSKELCFTDDINGCGDYEYTTLWGAGVTLKLFDETVSLPTNSDQLLQNRVKKIASGNILDLLTADDFKSEVNTTTFRNKVQKYIEDEFFFGGTAPNFVNLSVILANLDFNNLSFDCDTMEKKITNLRNEAGNGFYSDLDTIIKNINAFNDRYSKQCSKGGNNIDGSNSTWEQILDYDFNNICHDFASTIRLGGALLTIAKILIPFFIIGKAMLNLLGIITSGNPSEISKFIGKTLRSVVLAMTIFFVPTIINIIFGAVNSYQNVGTDPVKQEAKEDAEVCRECIFSPFSKSCTQYINKK